MAADAAHPDIEFYSSFYVRPMKMRPSRLSLSLVLLPIFKATEGPCVNGVVGNQGAIGGN